MDELRPYASAAACVPRLPVAVVQVVMGVHRDTLAALREVLAEKEAAEAAAAAEGTDDGVALTVSEDWGLSQFWYSEETSLMLAREALRAADASGLDGPVACLACPSTFKAIRSLSPTRDIVLFEVDRRFDRFGSQYVYYDFNKPMEVPDGLLGECAAVVLDPPFLNPDCLQAFASTAMLLLVDPSTCPVMVCTGATMCGHVRRLFDARPTAATVKHEGSRLSNPFALYVNYDPTPLGGYDDALEAAEASEMAAKPPPGK